MEGIQYSLTDCNDIIKEMGIEVSEMMACGGGAKNAVQRQMMADMFGCDVKTVTATEGPALGVADSCRCWCRTVRKRRIRLAVR